MNRGDRFPNITLEQAKELLRKQKSQIDRAMDDKIRAQNIAFDLLYPDFKPGDIERLKALVVYYQSELKQAIDSRDRARQEANEVKAENSLLKITLKKYKKEE